jgi:hypothetical protein
MQMNWHPALLVFDGLSPLVSQRWIYSLLEIKYPTHFDSPDTAVLFAGTENNEAAQGRTISLVMKHVNKSFHVGNSKKGDSVVLPLFAAGDKCHSRGSVDQHSAFYSDDA